MNNLNTAYRLVLTAEDVRTIAWVGGRYSWSAALAGFEEGVNELEEHEAWDLRDAFNEDTEGGHSPFPCLADGGLMETLYRFQDEIV